jgi:putative zinc finger/helix-turn-helix YgiT family protein
MNRPTETCPNCKGTITLNQENFRYTASGLPNVTLVGITVRRCGTCGWNAAVIPNVDGLHQVLAQTIIEKKSRLHGSEFRFLRKRLGESGSDCAALFGVTPETISRWENEKEQVSPVADRLLRVLVLTLEPRQRYESVVEQIKDVAKDFEATPALLGLRPKDHTWERTTLQASA